MAAGMQSLLVFICCELEMCFLCILHCVSNSMLCVDVCVRCFHDRSDDGSRMCASSREVNGSEHGAWEGGGGPGFEQHFYQQ